MQQKIKAPIHKKTPVELSWLNLSPIKIKIFADINMSVDEALSVVQWSQKKSGLSQKKLGLSKQKSGQS